MYYNEEEEEDEAKEQVPDDKEIVWLDPPLSPDPDVFAIDRPKVSSPPKDGQDKPKDEKGTLSLDELEEPQQLLEGKECPICLSPCISPAMLDTCFHTFCFVCILQWVNITPSCPLCKRGFKSILHNIKFIANGSIEFEHFYLDEDESTSRKRKAKAGARGSSSSKKARPELDVEAKESGAYPPDRMSFEPSALARRKAVYFRKLRAVPILHTPTGSGRTGRRGGHKEESSEGVDAIVQEVMKTNNEEAIARLFATNHPSEVPVKTLWEHKLKVWVRRELQALLDEEDVELLVVLVGSLFERFAQAQVAQRREGMQRRGASGARASSSSKGSAPANAGSSSKPLESASNASQAFEGMKKQVSEYLFERTGTFLHEFFCFAMSPRDMDVFAYDRAVRYTAD